MYHEVLRGEGVDAWTVLRERDFRLQMEYLKKHFTVVSLEEACARLKEGTSNVEKPLAVVTFDDGYVGNYKVVLPIIETLNIPVTVFVATSAVLDDSIYWYDKIVNMLPLDKNTVIGLDKYSLGNFRIPRRKGVRRWSKIQKLLAALKQVNPLEREKIISDILDDLSGDNKGCQPNIQLKHMTVDELKKLSESPLVTIGAHSHCHNRLSQLNSNDIKESIELSKELLQSWLGFPVRFFSYPDGDYNEMIIGAVREARLECALTTVSRLWDSEDSLFLVPRLGVGRYDSMDFFKLKTAGGTVLPNLRRRY